MVLSIATEFLAVLVLTSCVSEGNYQVYLILYYSYYYYYQISHVSIAISYIKICYTYSIGSNLSSCLESISEAVFQLFTCHPVKVV